MSEFNYFCFNCLNIILLWTADIGQINKKVATKNCHATWEWYDPAFLQKIRNEYFQLLVQTFDGTGLSEKLESIAESSSVISELHIDGATGAIVNCGCALLCVSEIVYTTTDCEWEKEEDPHLVLSTVSFCRYLLAEILVSRWRWCRWRGGILSILPYGGTESEWIDTKLNVLDSIGANGAFPANIQTSE